MTDEEIRAKTIEIFERGIEQAEWLGNKKEAGRLRKQMQEAKSAPLPDQAS